MYKLSDEAIAQMVKLLQMGMLTGTDVADQFRTIELSSNEENKLVPTDDFTVHFNESIQKMLDRAGN
jgi:hypothetical protein